MKSNKILLVDDDEDILDLLEYNLVKVGYEVKTASNGKKAIEIASSFLPDLIILDVMMPEMDGIETCGEIRKIPSISGTVITFLTARGEDYSQIAGFDAGADDYITKPIKPKVLLSKIKGLLRRNVLESENQIDNSSIQIDREKYIIIQEGTEISLPKKEFELLSLLMSRPNNVFTREKIFASVWGDDIVVGDRTIDVHIRKLREKIGDDYIKTVKGVGYKFVEVVD
ncbi:MAG: response regulator transcription factor [Flavobacteriales bacterium]|jgi:two-component system, OmpR family, alkaline phosphatase synthesis response regulator PhoP